jgi:hypothetical protein
LPEALRNQQVRGSNPRASFFFPPKIKQDAGVAFGRHASNWTSGKSGLLAAVAMNAPIAHTRCAVPAVDAEGCRRENWRSCVAKLARRGRWLRKPANNVPRSPGFCERRSVLLVRWRPRHRAPHPRRLTARRRDHARGAKGDRLGRRPSRTAQSALWTRQSSLSPFSATSHCLVQCLTYEGISPSSFSPRMRENTVAFANPKLPIQSTPFSFISN